MRHTTLLLAALLCSCLSEPTVGVQREAVDVPGPWVAPPETQAIAATQFVDVVDPPSVWPLGSCASTNPFECSCTHPACTPGHPGTVELREYLLGRFPGIGNSGTYCCRQNSNNLSELSVHAIGRAIDLGVALYDGDADNSVGDPVANWLVENAEYIGVQRVIWDHTYWNGERGFGSLGGSPHINHLHVELSIAGAAGETLFFTAGAPDETCTAECVGTRLINEDCSSVDCAATGAECLDAPPRCGEPPPPEPPEAVRAEGTSFPAIATVGDPMRLTFTGPERLFDTRSSTEGMSWNEAESELTWASGYPAAVEGLWLNLAVVSTEPGFVTVFPAGSPRPETSNINTSGRVRANLVPALLGDAQSLTFFERSPVELIGDVSATMGAAGEGLELVDPVRVLDSRSIDVPLREGETTAIDVGAPADVTGVLGTVAALRPETDAHLAAFPCGTAPETSTVNVLAEEIASNQVVSALGADGTLCLRPLRDMHVVFDVLGFFSPEGLLEYQPLTPVRLVDTRHGQYYENRLGAHQTIELPLGEAPGMPENGWAAVFNVATVQSDGDGHLTVFACERGSAPGTSAHNFGAAVRATLVTSDLGTSRRACLTTSTRAHVIVDLLGLWRRGDGAPPPEPDPTPDPEVDPGEPDAGPTDDGGPDGGLPDGDLTDDGSAGEEDAGDDGTEPRLNGGCDCGVTGRSAGGPLFALVVLAFALLLRRRSRAAG